MHIVCAQHGHKVSKDTNIPEGVGLRQLADELSQSLPRSFIGGGLLRGMHWSTTCPDFSSGSSQSPWPTNFMEQVPQESDEGMCPYPLRRGRLWGDLCAT
jgi:hypothetical protein